MTAGTLALLGGEGMRPESPLLRECLVAHVPGGSRAVILPVALAARKVGAAERRAALVSDALAGTGMRTDVLLILNHEQANDAARLVALYDADCMILPGGEPRVLTDILAGSMAWSLIRERLDRGAMLVAAGGSTTALGGWGFAPIRPPPQSLADLTYEPFAGLGLLPGAVILPHYDRLQPEVIGIITAICPPGMCFVGIDSQAVLINDSDGWRIRGAGRVAIWHAGQTAAIFEDGQRVPASILSHSQME